jgi:hypothetical protein
MCLKQILDITTLLFVVYGTYLLSRQLFIETIIEQFKNKLLNYKKYKDVPTIFRLAGRCYGFTKDDWFNADTGIGSERPINKLRDPAAPFKGFSCICIAAILQITTILLF